MRVPAPRADAAALVGPREIYRAVAPAEFPHLLFHELSLAANGAALPVHGLDFLAAYPDQSQPLHEFGPGDSWPHGVQAHERAGMLALASDTKLPQEFIAVLPVAPMSGGPLTGGAVSLALTNIGPAFSATMLFSVGDWTSAYQAIRAAALEQEPSAPLWAQLAASADDDIGLSDGPAAAVPEFDRFIDEALAFDLGTIEVEMQRLLRQCDRLLTADADASAHWSVTDATQTAVLFLCALELARWPRTRSSAQRTFSAERVARLAIWPDGAVEEGP